jgi:hypothetical protein
MLAQAYLTLVRYQAQLRMEENSQPTKQEETPNKVLVGVAQSERLRETGADLLPLSVAEVSRLLWQLVWHRVPDPEAVLSWSC